MSTFVLKIFPKRGVLECYISEILFMGLSMSRKASAPLWTLRLSSVYVGSNNLQLHTSCITAPSTPDLVIRWE